MRCESFDKEEIVFYYINSLIKTISVGEATKRIWVAVAELWRHNERAEQSKSKTRLRIVQLHRLLELKLER